MILLLAIFLLRPADGEKEQPWRVGKPQEKGEV